MISGAYPCCDKPLKLTIPIGKRLPLYQREICPHCGTPVWHMISRFQPTSWIEADFLDEHNVDPATGTVTKKG